MVLPRSEIKSSLDLRPMGIRVGSAIDIKVKPNPRYAHCKAEVDYGQHRPPKVDPTKLVTKRRGELFGRIEPANLARFIGEGKTKVEVVP